MSIAGSASSSGTRIAFHRLGVWLASSSLVIIVLLAFPAAIGLPGVVAAVAVGLAIWIGIESLFSP
jgi:hypothetical protein